jgi:hypothetical protein
MIRYMTDEERMEVGRKAHELEGQFGTNAHKFAAKRAERALEEGDTERAQFWKWVEAALRPRASKPNST